MFCVIKHCWRSNVITLLFLGNRHEPPRKLRCKTYSKTRPHRRPRRAWSRCQVSATFHRHPRKYQTLMASIPFLPSQISKHCISSPPARRLHRRSLPHHWSHKLHIRVQRQRQAAATMRRASTTVKVAHRHSISAHPVHLRSPNEWNCRRHRARRWQRNSSRSDNNRQRRRQMSPRQTINSPRRRHRQLALVHRAVAARRAMEVNRHREVLSQRENVN